MSDDEDSDANEQAFAELQENLQEQGEAENEANRLSALKRGDNAGERRSPEVETLPETSFAAMVDFLKPALKLRIPVA